MMGNYHVRCGAGEKSEVVTPETYLSLFTLPDSFVEKLSTMRSRNMSAVIIVQNLIQLKRKFPKFDMDKDLIGNCSIIDILGAPDMDSCEYLSKHFGTQTIHKASDSDSKDYKGSSTRSEDVMEKSLLSAEDIFAMKKDGECAIVVKGTDPLYQTKCQMEKTAFVKLLCRKHNPYDPGKRKQKGKEKQRGKIFQGEKAKEEARKLREDRVSIIKLTEDDIDLLFEASKSGNSKVDFPPSREQLKQYEENKRKYDESRQPDNPIDFEIYMDENCQSEEGMKKYKARVMTVTKLINAGYSKASIKAFHILIMHDYDAGSIMEMFRPDCAIEYISQVVDVIEA